MLNTNVAAALHGGGVCRTGSDTSPVIAARGPSSSPARHPWRRCTWETEPNS